VGEVVRFPRKPLDPENSPRGPSGRPLTRCEGVLHVFSSKDEPCQCGDHWWVVDDEPEAPAQCELCGVFVAPEIADTELVDRVCADVEACKRRCDLRDDLLRLTSRRHVPFEGWVGQKPAKRDDPPT
jgi:hypothetical protein